MTTWTTTRMPLLATAGSAALLGAVLGGCGSDEPGAAADGSGTVVAEIAPLAFVAERVAGDDLEVVTLAPPGVEAHDLELSPSQVADVARASLVLYLADFAPAVDDAVEQNAADRGLEVLALLGVMDGGDTADDAHADDENGDDQDDDHDHGGVDPHVWLDPTLLGELATALADRLGEDDPDRADAYANRAAALVDELTALDDDVTAGLDRCTSHVLVTSHSAFGHLAARYGLEQVSVAGLEPDSEPSAARIAEIQHVVEEEGVTTVFAEPNGAAAVEAIAADLGLETAVLDPVETLADGDDYLTVMRANLDALRSGLGCG